MTSEPDDPVGVWELLEAIEAVIKAADPEKRKALARTIDAYSDDFPDDFFWAIGPQSPGMLSNLLMAIDSACRPDTQSKPRAPIRLVTRSSDNK